MKDLFKVFAAGPVVSHDELGQTAGSLTTRFEKRISPGQDRWFGPGHAKNARELCAANRNLEAQCI